MTLREAIKILNNNLSEYQPKTFSSTWIFKKIPSVYMHFHKNIRTENNDIDWDKITSLLKRKYQKRWIRYRNRIAKPYESRQEVETVLNKYKSRLYLLIAPQNEMEQRLRNRILISLVRIAQKGNIDAKNEILKWTTYVVEEWIDKYFQVKKWKGYTDDIEDKISSCIRCYRYTGSFLGYLFKTLEYSGRGIVPIQKYSLDDPVLDGSKTRIDFVIQEESDSYM